jgi:modulator of drug activity B
MDGKGTGDLFLNITSNYRFCGVEIMQGYNCFDIFKDGNILHDLGNYTIHLDKLV